MLNIGIAIGGTRIVGGIVTREGNIIDRRERPTPIQEGGPQILQAAIEVAGLLVQAVDQPIHGVGIGTGGQIDTEQGTVFSATDLIPGWKGIRITDAFTGAFGIPSAVDNDVNVLALAERRFGVARFLQRGTVIFLALGTGVGGALLFNGELHYGARWSGAELGHMQLFPPMYPNARRDLGGHTGTLEAYCSGPGMVQTWRELSGRTDPGLTGYDVADDANENPGGTGSQAIRKTGEYLGVGLVSLANMLDPDLIIIGGGLSELGESLLGPARQILEQYALPGPGKCPVVTPQLGADAAVVGAASLVMTSSSAAALTG